MRVLDSLKTLLGGGKPLIPRDPAVFKPIGVVRNRVKEPRPHGWEDVRSDIFLRDDLEGALDGLDGFSHVIVVFHIDKVPESEQALRIRVGNEPEERGILATRSQRRPNPIGVSVVPIVHRRQGVLRVLGLDAVNGSPVLDIKPYLTSYDAPEGATQPSWTRETSSAP
ncbi:MAG: tRNA (N6-threonylcarbamoyladenosine(37)-N6)-methyltransferase TrmO [Dehalococcoidia bacterium]|nr:tRNA (N6-threonylcarbamoyladenosine(37)-N6)-methyltransferase TrmO [Dehalococcoidia bacterium]